MTSEMLNRTVSEFVTERPSRSRVFERFGIDYCCGGKQPLSAACEAAQLDPAVVLNAIRESDEAVSQESVRVWAAASMPELVEHIVSTHHAYLWRELPRLAEMGAKIARVHGPKHPEVVRCHEVFASLKAELESHMLKEEHVLFPLLQDLDDPHCTALIPPEVVANPIAVAEDEHDAAARALRELCSLTRRYTPPPDACNTFRAWLDGLAELEADMHRHVHKENNILFPRAMRRFPEPAVF
jgi:regulator of cell morphogenesis and NO signaling